jgi:hypothetical protein
MLSSKVVLLALAVAGAGGLGAGVWAGAAGHGLAGRGPGFGHDRVMLHKFVDFLVEEKLTEIGATEAQKQKVREVKQRLAAEGQALHAAPGTPSSGSSCTPTGRPSARSCSRSWPRTSPTRPA